MWNCKKYEPYREILSLCNAILNHLIYFINYFGQHSEEPGFLNDRVLKNLVFVKTFDFE